jgi:hypothetical protein
MEKSIISFDEEYYYSFFGNQSNNRNGKDWTFFVKSLHIF